MTTIALLNPDSLVGKEVQEKLQSSGQSWWDDLRLLTTDSEKAGALTEVRGSAELVQALNAETLAGIDLLIDCSAGSEDGQLPGGDPGDRTTIASLPDRSGESGIPIVAGVNLQEASRGELLISPHPAVIGVALVLKSLDCFELAEANCTVVQPVSMLGNAAMDELFEQARSILTFSSDIPTETLGSQLVFNLGLGSDEVSREADRQLSRVLGAQPRVSVQVVQGGIFHGVGASLHLKFNQTLEPGEVLAAFQQSACIEVNESEDPPVSPTSIVGEENIVIGALRSVGGPSDSFWLWLAWDNLTRGSASNIFEIAESVMSVESN